MKLLKKLKEINLYKLVFVFLVLQPFLDILMCIYDEKISILGFSIVTLIRLIFIFLIFLVSYLKDNNKTRKRILCVYLSLVFIYSVIHIFRFINFNFSLINLVFSKGILFNEIFYIVRMTIPILLIYSFSVEKYDIKKLNKIFVTTTLVISGIIILSNLFKVGFLSYSEDNIKRVSENIFYWFRTVQNIQGSLLMTRGFFVSANQLSVLLGILLFINFYLSLERKKVVNYISILCLISSMFMVGTRVASYGAILISIISFVAFIFSCVFTKRWTDLNIINLVVCVIIIGLSFFLYEKSPIKNKYIEIKQEREIAKIEYDNKKRNETNPDTSTENPCVKDLYSDRTNKHIQEVMSNYNFDEKNIFLGCNIKYYPIYNYFMNNYYPKKFNEDFWLSMMLEKYENSMDSRYVKNRMVLDLREKNSNILDTYFGIGYTTLRNFVYLENDIICQFYTLGIFGVILFILPYLFVAIYSLLRILLKPKMWTFKNIIFIGTILFTFCVAYFAGHVFDEFFTVFYLSFLCGQLLKLEELNES